jgi:uronate dehydrogenase
MAEILITGAAGQVARQIRPHLLARHGALVLTDRRAPGALAPGERFVPADLTDRASLDAALSGITAIVHLGGQAVEADWPTVLSANVAGLITLFEAAHAAGVARLVFASSLHAVGFAPRHARPGSGAAPRPDSRYGVSKAFGEALASLYADKHGMRTLSIRIGNVNPKPIDARRLSIWVHPEDLAQLVTIGLTHPDAAGQVVYGVSANTRGWVDNAEAHRLGYRPAHDSEAFAAEALAADVPPDPVGDLFQGGSFASAEFDGDPERARWR